MSDSGDSARSADGPQHEARRLGVSDIDDVELEALANNVRHVTERDLGASVESVYVMGSFARGEAARIWSDIDLRIVVGYPPAEEEREQFEERLKNEYGPDWVPSECGYLDARVSPLEPTESEPHQEVA